MDLTVIFIVFTIFIKLTYKMVDTYLIFSDQEEKNKYGDIVQVDGLILFGFDREYFA